MEVVERPARAQRAEEGAGAKGHIDDGKSAPLLAATLSGDQHRRTHCLDSHPRSGQGQRRHR